MVERIIWFKKPCGVGEHTEIISNRCAECIICGAVRRIDWSLIGSKWYIEQRSQLEEDK